MKPEIQETYTTFANPFLACVVCGERAVGFMTAGVIIDPLDPDPVRTRNWPCLHQVAVVSLCPSWSPVDGCACEGLVGDPNHSAPPESRRDARKKGLPERAVKPPVPIPVDPAQLPHKYDGSGTNPDKCAICGRAFGAKLHSSAGVR